ncbi:MAG: hypothetical protein II998_04035 [Clostridia bacterium]|nr:hypothetical protein [Clostridia bacterium]
MCNIAGYAGTEQAAPKLLEMLRRQQAFDGGVCTGIATIYNGMLFYRKVVGDVDTLIHTTDALSLPGTIGIAHSRPGGNTLTYAYTHPAITDNEDMAYITNGTGRGIGYKETAQEVCTSLENDGYLFKDRCFVEDSFFPKLKDGSHVSCITVRMNLIDRYIKEGNSIPEAMAKTLSKMYTDNVTLLLNLREPEKIFALRTTRPMAALMEEDGVYMATTRFAFPDGAKGEVMQLPLHQACEITKNGVKVTDAKLSGVEPVCEVTPYAYSEGYKRIVNLLTGKKDAPLYFDDLEMAVYNDMKDIWPEQHHLVQDARLVYDVLWQLKCEGRLKTTLRPMAGSGHLKERIYMWLED